MDHSDKKKQNLEVLGLENVNVLCLPELWDAIKEKLPSDVSKMRILNIYVMWLHEQLATFDISAEDAVRDCISTWYEFLKATNYDSRIIAEALDDWQRDEAQHDPTSWRRLGIIAAELRAVMISFVPPSKKSPGTSPDGHYGHMHPDRIMLSRESPSASGLGDGKHEVIVIDPDADLPPKNGGTPRGVGSNLPFLTGSNRLVLGDIADSLPHREEEKVSQVAAAEPRTTSITPNSKDPQSDISKTSGKSSSGYVCFRCGVPGKCSPQSSKGNSGSPSSRAFAPELSDQLGPQIRQNTAKGLHMQYLWEGCRSLSEALPEEQRSRFRYSAEATGDRVSWPWPWTQRA